MLDGVVLHMNTDFLDNPVYWREQAKHIIYTGTIDSFYNYCFGKLSYRSLRFETEVLPIPNYQGNAVINYTDVTPEYTRIIEHKHFMFGTQPNTVISREYPLEWTSPKVEPYYPINDTVNQALYQKYVALGAQDSNVIFGGRLGSYQYFDMQDTIISALKLSQEVSE